MTDVVVISDVLVVLLWATFRFVLPIVLLIFIGTKVNQKYNRGSVL